MEKSHSSHQGRRISSSQSRQRALTTNHQLLTIDYTLYVITVNIPKLGRTHLEVAKEAIAGGATVIQFREKSGSNRELLQVVQKLCKLTEERRVPLIINDRVDIAVAMGASGVHLGQTDMPLFLARKILRDGKIVGCSATNLEEALRAERSGADYLGVGPIFPTPSKEDAAPPIGLKTLAEIKRKVKIPVIAIGGITQDNVVEVIRAGANGIAVISAVAQAPDMRKATQELLVKIKVAKEEMEKGK